VKYLSSIEITFVESFSLCGKKELVLQALASEARVNIYFAGIVYLNISNDVLDMDDEEISVVEVSHEYRELQQKDLERYLFEWDGERVRNPFHVIQINGNTILEIICESIKIEKVLLSGD
jgi:hypothetical protein